MTDSRTSGRRDRAIALAAGGTGGHLFPAEALARELMVRGHQVVIHTERRGAGYASALEGIEHVVLPARSLAGGIAGKLKAALVIGRAAVQARGDLRRRGAALMVGFGGYPSFAPALAAKSMGLPLLLHEQATRLSMANRQLLRLADGVATSFAHVAGLEGFDAAKVFETGNPVRRSILDARGDYPPFGDGEPLRLLVVGGSRARRCSAKWCRRRCWRWTKAFAAGCSCRCSTGAMTPMQSPRAWPKGGSKPRCARSSTTWASACATRTC